MIDLWHAMPGDEERVKAAEYLFDDSVSSEATERFLREEANHLVIAYADGEPAGFVSGTEIVHPDQAKPELFLNELGVDPDNEAACKTYAAAGGSRARAEVMFQWGEG